MPNTVPLEFLILWDKFNVFLLVQLFSFSFVALFHLPHLYISIDPLTSHATVETLNRVFLDAVSTSWTAFCYILKFCYISEIELTLKALPGIMAPPKEHICICPVASLFYNPDTTQPHSSCPSTASQESLLLLPSFSKLIMCRFLPQNWHKVTMCQCGSLLKHLERSQLLCQSLRTFLKDHEPNQF